MFINNPNQAVVSTDVTQFGSNAVVTGVGKSGVGIPRVTVADDSGVLPLFVTGTALAPVTGTPADYTPNADCCMTILSNTHTSLPVYVRDQAANTDVKGVLLNAGATMWLPTVAALRITNPSATAVTVTVNELRRS